MKKKNVYKNKKNSMMKLKRINTAFKYIYKNTVRMEEKKERAPRKILFICVSREEDQTKDDHK